MADSNRGFAAMDEDKQKDIASEGGKARHSNKSNDNNKKSSSSPQTSGAAGSTEAAKRGGEHSHRNK
ncbi:MAG TPA: KGG domain-containing protein [Candidatus Saccharimonadales bacterium]|nr:KGG domain-containing protein [Candidatus Saccharimonadales bacterium]